MLAPKYLCCMPLKWIQTERLRGAAIEAIRTLGKATNAIRQLLKEIAGNINDAWDIRWQCAETLALLKDGDQSIRDILHEGLKIQSLPRSF